MRWDMALWCIVYEANKWYWQYDGPSNPMERLTAGPQVYCPALKKFSSEEAGPIDIVLVHESDLLFYCISGLTRFPKRSNNPRSTTEAQWFKWMP